MKLSRPMKLRYPLFTKITAFLNEFAIPVLYLIVILGLIVFIINRDLPKVGHDYDFFIPRMLDTHLHHKVNGLGIQWYTPNFGAGTPAYPNPQYIQYSLPQLLMFVINPWLALMVSLIAYAAVGFMTFYMFLRYEMGWIRNASALGASFILANGFFIEHAIVGHVSFQPFPLLGVIVFLLFSQKIGFLPAGILIGLLSAIIVNQGGFIILVIFVFSLAILLPLIYLMRSDLFSRKFLATLLTSSLAAMLLSLSKISAISAFMRFFPRIIEDNYEKTYFEGIIGIITQLTGFNFIVPKQLFTAGDSKTISLFFQNSTGGQYGIWETNIALSPGLLILLLIGIGYLIVTATKTRLTISRDKIAAALFLFLAVWLVTDMTLAQGWLYQFVKPLPLIRSIHVNGRFTASFIFPLALLGAFIFHEIFKDKRIVNPTISLLLGILTVCMLCLYLVISPAIHGMTFNLESALQTYAQIDKGWNFTINDLAEIKNMEVFRQGSSNLAFEDPIFGYDMGYFKPKTTPGPIFEIRNGYYNMTNPASYVFPEENNLQSFELFRIDQKTDLELFVNHKQPNFKISTWQKFTNVLSLAALIICLLYLVFEMARASMRGWQELSRSNYAYDQRML